MTHKQFWRGIDKMAHDHGMSVSGLALAAGLDATAFNKSKRFQDNGNERWPKLKSLIGVCDVAGISLAHFFEKYVR